MSKITLTCPYCQVPFVTERSHYNRNIKMNHRSCCSRRCADLLNSKKIRINCITCQKEIVRNPSQIVDSQKVFCSCSCSAIYNNTHKKKGTRVSKLEIYLQKELMKLYPLIQFDFNHKETINSELDIYIPSLKLAFELNGIFHYEPIYGKEKLKQIQNNDNRKFQACLERDIELVIIDSSKMINFKKQKAQIFLDIIVKIIDTKIKSDV